MRYWRETLEIRTLLESGPLSRPPRQRRLDIHHLRNINYASIAIRHVPCQDNRTYRALLQGYSANTSHSHSTFKLIITLERRYIIIFSFSSPTVCKYHANFSCVLPSLLSQILIHMGLRSALILLLPLLVPLHFIELFINCII